MTTRTNKKRVMCTKTTAYMSLGFIKLFSVILVLLCSIHVSAQEDIIMRVKKSDAGKYVHPVSGNYFRICGSRVDVSDLDAAICRTEKRHIPRGYVHSKPSNFVYIYDHAPVDTSLHISDLNEVYKVEYDGDCVMVEYFKDNLLYHYVYKRSGSRWELEEIHSYKMKETEPGIIRLYNYLSPKQIIAKRHSLVLHGYTTASANATIKHYLDTIAAAQSIGLVYVNKAKHVVLTANCVNCNSETEKAKYHIPADSTSYWKVAHTLY